jgi:HEAT repeat protein
MSLKKGEAQKKLLELLKDGPKSLDELINTGVMSTRTLYDVRKKLLVKGKIKEIDDYWGGEPVRKLSLVEAEKLASDREINFLLKLAESDNYDIRLESLQDLKALSKEKCIFQAKARDFLLNKVDDEDYDGVLKHLLETILQIIERAKAERRLDVVSDIKKHSEKFARLISDKSKDGTDRLTAIKILGELGDPIVLEPIIDIIEKDEEVQLTRSPKYGDKIDLEEEVYKSLVIALVKISKENKVLVWKHLYRLMSRGDERNATKAKNILRHIRRASEIEPTVLRA